MTRLALLAPVAIASLFALAAPERAAAQCLPEPTMNGDSVECLADDTDGFATSFDDVQTWIDVDVTVSNDAGPAIAMPGIGSIVINDGIIGSSDGDGVSVGDMAQIDNYGSISAGGDGVVMGAAGSLMNLGVIDAGRVGVTAGLDAIVVNDIGGRIVGADASIRFGDGVDELTMMGGASVRGDAFFGGGGDLLIFETGQLARPAGSSVFHGGGADDMVDFGALDMSALLALSLLPALGQDGLALKLATGGAPETLLFFAEFEAFVFGGMQLTVDDMVAKGLPAAVPLPGALPMLVGALGLAGLVARRRAA